jgi:CHAT domain
LTVGSEQNKSAALAHVDDPIPSLIAFQQRAGDRIPDARVLAFETVARRKGRVLDQLHDWSQSLHDSSDPQTKRRFEQWKSTLQCEASLAMAMSYRDLKPAVIGTCSLNGSELEGRYERLLHDLRTNWTEPLGRQAVQALGALKQRSDALEASLSREIPRFAGASGLARMDDIRAQLKPDELLIELVEYSGARGKRYGGFLLDRRGKPQWIDLGGAGPIDAALQDLITAANDWTVSVRRGEKRAADSSEQTAQDALRTLSQKLRPLIDAVSARVQIQRLRIAPDGMLNLLPFAALSDGRRFLIERFAISYVPVSRDLITAAPRRAGGPIVIAMSPGGGRFETLEGAEAECRKPCYSEKVAPPSSESSNCSGPRCFISSGTESSEAIRMPRPR